MKYVIGDKTLSKIRALAKYLLETHGVTLARAISMRKESFDKILKGEECPSFRVIKKIAVYFSIPVETLLDDNLVLPDFDHLILDQDLLSIQRNDVANQIEKLAQKHYISRNWNMLGYKKRVNVILSILLIAIPLFAYIFYCTTSIATEKIEDVRKYRQGSEPTLYDTHDPLQVSYHEKLQTTCKENNPDAYYVDVKVGVNLEKIKNISSATSGFEERLQLYFKFDKDEFLNMFRHYARNVLMDTIIDEYYETSEEPRPADSINFKEWEAEHAEYFESWCKQNDSRFYPGETPSNVLTDKETMFDIGNGEFVADSYGTIKGLEEVQYIDEEGNLRTMCYQKVKFNVHVEKAFDSVRYPLDSVQFKLYITPIMDANYIRYTPDTDRLENGELVSGFGPYFSITNGYRPIKEVEGIKNFSMRVNYFYDRNNDPAIDFDHTMKTQLEVTVRANRQGISLFLQAFINLFSVVIWITIAFYSQSHTGENSIDMLGTGLFGVISSMLVGLSMVSDAGIMSIITMINIFTLAVIMIMTYQSIAAKRAQVRKDKVQIAYNGIKLRILFYILTIATIVMFIALPALAYMWNL